MMIFSRIFSLHSQGRYGNGRLQTTGPMSLIIPEIPVECPGIGLLNIQRLTSVLQGICAGAAPAHLLFPTPLPGHIPLRRHLEQNGETGAQTFWPYATRRSFISIQYLFGSFSRSANSVSSVLVDTNPIVVILCTGCRRRCPVFRNPWLLRGSRSFCRPSALEARLSRQDPPVFGDKRPRNLRPVRALSVKPAA